MGSPVISYLVLSPRGASMGPLVLASPVVLDGGGWTAGQQRGSGFCTPGLSVVLSPSLFSPAQPALGALRQAWRPNAGCPGGYHAVLRGRRAPQCGPNSTTRGPPGISSDPQPLTLGRGPA